MTARLSTCLLCWIRDRRGSVSIEFVVGTVVIVTTTLAGMDLYRLVDAQSAALRAAVTMADYVSQESAPSGAFIDDLARFLYRNEIALPAHAAFVMSAVSRAPVTDGEADPPALVRWTRTTTVAEDPDSPPLSLGQSCGRLGELEEGQAAVQAELEMAPGEMVVVVEVCVELLPEAFASGGFIAGHVYPTRFYQHQILPVRGANLPVEPA
ncbi:MAG: hypothetical protein OXF11_15000 [Deltaproteobacteria bacterium]|nr:hypothetical protein [Deltaproteobacteria bacterium]